eukprot:Skav208510  [mRNA]  locus=scaffold2509:35177:39569:- [translate_table: standard]
MEMKPATLTRPTISWCRHWKQRFGWTMITRGQDDSQWLAYDHPDMIASRASFQKLLVDEQIHTGLVLNYDQMWRTCWQTTRFKLAYKSRRYAGQMYGGERMGPRDDKKITSVKGARRSLTEDSAGSVCFESDDDDRDDDDGDSIPGDELGLEGQAPVFDDHDPAPAPQAGSVKVPKIHWEGGEFVPDGDHHDDEKLPSDSDCVYHVYKEKNGEVVKEPAPSQFREREAFKVLEQKGLTDTIPVPGAGLFYHNSSSQWHTRFGWTAERNSAPTWNSTLRSEVKALLIALHAMWSWWCENSSTASSADRKCLALLKKELDNTPF